MRDAYLREGRHGFGLRIRSDRPPCGGLSGPMGGQRLTLDADAQQAAIERL